MWIGTVVSNGTYNTQNALVNNGGLHGAQDASAVVSLVAGTYYPVRFLYGNSVGGGTFQVSYSTGTRTYDFTNLLYSEPNVPTRMPTRAPTIGWSGSYAGSCPTCNPSSQDTITCTCNGPTGALSSTCYSTCCPTKIMNNINGILQCATTGASCRSPTSGSC